MLLIVLTILFVCFAVLRMKPWALSILGKCSTTEHTPARINYFQIFWLIYFILCAQVFCLPVICSMFTPDAQGSQEEGSGAPGTGTTGGCKSPYGWWVLNLSPCKSSQCS